MGKDSHGPASNGSPVAAFDPAQEVRVLRQPSVYLVGLLAGVALGGLVEGDLAERLVQGDAHEQLAQVVLVLEDELAVLEADEEGAEVGGSSGMHPAV